MAWRFVILAPLLASCAAQPRVVTEYQRVEVPVYVRPTPPVALTAPVGVPDGLRFVAPDDPAATSALTADGEAALVRLIEAYVSRLAAWRAWAGE